MRIVVSGTPELREAMDHELLDLIDDPDLVGSGTCVIELTGDPVGRLEALESAAANRFDR